MDKQTDYDLYYRTLHEVLSKKLSDRNTINFIHRFTKRKVKSTTQALVKVQTKEKFFKNPSKIDELTIDEHLDIFRESCAVTENYLKLIYGIKHNCDTDQEIEGLEKTEFYQIWKDIKNDVNLKLFTKPFPNTIYWNASKHSGITKKVTLKQIEFRSNEGNSTLSYDDFVKLVRELYACMIALSKINLIIISQTGTFWYNML